MFFPSGAHAALLISDPPRAASLAVWPVPDDADSDRVDTRKLFIDDEFRETRVLVVPLSDALDELLTLRGQADVTESVRAWSVAAKLTIELISRGRLRPTSSVDGFAAWTASPLDPADVGRRSALASSLPITAHCAMVDESQTLVLTASSAVAQFSDAVADAFVRTSAAKVVVSDDPFAVTEPASLTSEACEWLHRTDTIASTVVTALQVEPPAGDDQFGISVWVYPVEDRDAIVSLDELWTTSDADPRLGNDPELAALKTLHRAQRVWSPAARLLEQSVPGNALLSDDELSDLLGPAAYDLAIAGLEIIWPDSVAAPVELVPIIAPVEDEAALVDLEDALLDGDGDDFGDPTASGSGALAVPSELRWMAMLGGEPLTDDEIDQLHRLDRPLARIRDRWVRIDPADLARIDTKQAVSSGEALAAALGGTITFEGRTYRAEVRGPIAQLAQRLHALSETPAPVADGLDGTLREYQERGLAWLYEMSELGLGGVLADDMGLGKTIQILAVHLALREQKTGPTLVVCPATLIGNWEREAATFAPGVPIRRYHGAERSLDDVATDEIVVVTYGVIRRDADTLSTVNWGLVVADEAQVIKNPLSLTAKELRRIPTKTRFALTGTPVENRLADLWALLDWTTPGLLGPLARFRRDIAIPIERNQDDAVAGAFSKLIAPFVLRRRKTDPSIAPELPPKTETDQIVELTTEQSALYKSVADEVLNDISAAEGIARRGLVLRLLTALKQICNHPAHFLGEPSPLHGRSGKLAAVDELLDAIVAEGDSTLMFTQYVEMGHLLERHLHERGVSTLFLHGKVPVAKRQAMIDKFQAGGIDVFVISLKAGGTGLNLTQATHVIHYDRWWNPAVEDQASDRAWRIGQDRPVQVHRMMCAGTLEDRIGAVLESKRQLAEAVVGGGEAWISELSDAELADLVGLAGTS